ncbi:MAG: AmmeMemoRadiSam system protein B [Rhodobacteraceae bacterium]|nr:AmmeMemoRadiSam system protein B [Paracoccaceae bacterium]
MFDNRGAESRIRPPAVAGLFYPDAPAQLQQTVASLFAAARNDEKVASRPAPKAVIVPHAGYVYSGQLAARAFALFAPDASRITRIVLLGPAHRVALRGLAVPSVSAFATPLGKIDIDRDAVARLADLPFVHVSDKAHAEEHSLEVQLPLLQNVLPNFSLVPIVVGDADPAEVASVIDMLWGDGETRFVVSSDLSHFLNDRAARAMDEETASAIERFDESALTYNHACGRGPISGLLSVARTKKLTVKRLGLCNSSDTAGSKDRVVGYGAWAFE